MSKALKALEKIANLPMKEQYDVVYKDGKPMVVYRVVADLCGKEIKTIKSAIKRLEDLEKWFLDDKDYKNYKALDVIKEIFNLRVYEKQGQFFISSGFNGETPISKEKADLLKEELL